MKIPSEPKIYKTKYSNFKGVDFTNDQANVFYRRSPDSINMMPDEAGRPIKRHGYDTVVTNDALKSLYKTKTGEDVMQITINRIHYFTLHGIDHIFIFTDVALYSYGDVLKILSTDKDIIGSYDRCFYFDANGVAAFYIYGAFKIWKYWYDNGFSLVEAEPYTPIVLVGNSPSGTDGTLLEGYNLLGNTCIEQFYHNAKTEITNVSDGISVILDAVTYAQKATKGTLTFSYSTQWDKSLDDYGITVVGTAEGGSSFTVKLSYEVMLSRDIAQTQVDEVFVNASQNLQFDKEITVLDKYQSLSANKCVLHDSDSTHENSWIEFNEFYMFQDGNEDAIRIKHPVLAINVVHTDKNNITATASVNGRR